MESFKEKYIESCLTNKVEPLKHLLDKISLNPGPSEQAEAISTKHDGINLRKQQSMVRELNISSQTLSLKMAKSLADALESDAVFLQIILGDCLLGDDGCIVICNALKENKTFEQLDLKGNHIRADGCLAISQLLKVSANIKKLSLEWNCIGIWETCLKSLGDALSINQSLRHLDLRNNKIGPQGGVLLASGLRGNTTLRHLDIRWNNLGLLGGRALLDMLKWNETLVYVDLQGNDIPDDLANAIEMALERNRKTGHVLAEASEQTKYLSNTLEQLASENDETVNRLKSKLLSYETETKSLSEQLNVVSGEAENTKLNCRVLKTKLDEEKAKREQANNKLLEIEQILLRERREFSDKCQKLAKELENEREKYQQMDMNHKTRLHQEIEQKLIVDAKLKEAELNLERVMRKNATLNKENKRLSDTCQELDDKHANLKDKYRQDMESLESKYRKKFRDNEEEKESLKLEMSALKQQISSLKQSKENEENNRNLANSNYHALLKERDQLQTNLDMQMQKARQFSLEFDSRLQAERDNIKANQLQLANEKKLVEEESNRLRTQLDQLKLNQEETDKLERENKALKAEVERLTNILDRRKDDEISRAHSLAEAIHNYVRAIERGQ